VNLDAETRRAPESALPKARLADESLESSRHPYVVHARLARLVAHGPCSRSDLARATGLARSTIAEYLAPMLAVGLIRETAAVARARGRPATELALDPNAGAVLVADLGAHHSRVALADLDQRVLARDAFTIDIAAGPTTVLDEIAGRFDAMRSRAGVAPESVRSVVIGLPGPVDFERGMPVRPPIMPGWDGFDVAGSIGARVGAPVLVDNDVNLLALGEARVRAPAQAPLLFVKVSTGIGCGIVTADGRLHRGADGAAGDIGHIRVPNHDDAVCRCGNVGCVEAVASGSAIVAAIARDGAAGIADLDGLARLVTAGDARAVRLVRDAAREIGEVVAMLVNVYNPAAIVLGGHLARISDDLLAGVRGVVYRRALPLATRRLVIANSDLGELGGLIGGLVLAIERAVSPSAIERLAGAAR